MVKQAKFKTDPVSGMYKPSGGFLKGQPPKDKAFGYCCYSLHRGYMSIAMVRKHKCFDKVCPYLKPYNHPYWNDIYQKRGTKVIKAVQNKFQSGMDYFEYKGLIFDAQDVFGLENFIKIHHIYSVEQLKFGTNSDKLQKTAIKQNQKEEEENNMVNFSDNLKTWKAAKKKSNLGRCTGLGDNRINELLDGKDMPTKEEAIIIAQSFQVPFDTFMRGVEKNFKVESNTKVSIPGANRAPAKGAKPENKETYEKYKDLLDRFYESPAAYKKTVTAIVYGWLLDKLSMTHSEAERALHLSYTSSSKYKTGKMAFSTNEFAAILKNAPGYGIHAEDIIKKYVSTYNNYISNYNLSIYKKVAGLSDAKLSQLLGQQNAYIWQITNYKYAVSDRVGQHIESLCHIPWTEFKCRLLSENDFKEHFNVKPTTILPETIQQIEPIKEPEPVKESIVEPNTLESCKGSMSESEERTIKFYRKLSPENKKKAQEYIEKLFWAEL